VSSAPHLLFEKDGRQIATLETDSVPHVALENHGLTIDDIDGKSLTHLSCVDIAKYYVENQRFSGQRGFAAERNPFVAAALLNSDVWKYSQHALSGFGKPISFVASSIGHGVDSATAMPSSGRWAIHVVSGALTSEVDPRADELNR
jgi:hypothetical protein